MKVLYIGGTGEISYSCVHAGVKRGHETTVFNRGRSREPLPDGVTKIAGDMNDETAYRALGEMGFDVVCQFFAFDLQRIETDLEVFGGKVKQYVFISTASAYQKPQRSHIITEETPIENPYWDYSQTKADMEKRLMQAHESGQLPVTIVRPSHTYRTRFPGTFISGDHQAWRMLSGKPAVVHGDGTSLWVLTHSEDFADAFVRLLGNEKTLGEAYHITSDEANTWNRIVEAIGVALGVSPELVHVASDTLVRYDKSWAGPLWGDKACPVIFDNSKVKAAVGGWDCKTHMTDGMKRAAEYVRPRLEHFRPEPRLEALVDRIVAEQRALGQ